VNLEEYREWLKEHGNKEEAAAYEVAKEIVDYYHGWHNEKELTVECLPRHVFCSEDKRERFEFDLLIRISWVSNRPYTRLIGVEFKETDIEKCVYQAIARRPHVDRMFIATNDVLVDPIILWRMVDYSIGWIVWSPGFAKIVMMSRRPYPWKLQDFVKSYIREEIEKTLKEVEQERRTQSAMASLYNWFGSNQKTLVVEDG